MSDLLRTYKLTDSEYHTVMSALNHAESDAVHQDGQQRFETVSTNLLKQFESQEGVEVVTNE